jgi:glycerate 2-kinase
VPTVTLSQKRATAALLLSCGADIREINAVRKHLSTIKGGLAARFAAPADVIVIVVSDVIGDALDTIASGPFAPDASTFTDAWRILEKYQLMHRVPMPVRQYLFDGQHGKYAETPKENDEVFQKVTHVLCTTNKVALDAAAEKAKALGYQPVMVAEPVAGECREAARAFAVRARSLLDQGRSFCLLSGGEPTVNLGAAHGRGGRNQEFALSAAFTIENSGDIIVASCGTDGTDGPTDAAGAMVDGATLGRASRAGLDARAALDGHKAYPFFEQLDDLIKTGPTNTNVMDIQVALVGAA